MLLPLLLADTGAAPPPLAHFPPHRRRCCCATPRLNTCPALPHKDEFAKEPPTGDLPPPFTILTVALQEPLTRRVTAQLRLPAVVAAQRASARQVP